MLIDIKELFFVILFISLIILIIVTIVAMLNLIKSLKRVNRILDDVDIKVRKLDGLFDIIDNTTDVINTFSDKIANGISNGITWLVNRKKKGDKDE